MSQYPAAIDDASTLLVPVDASSTKSLTASITALVQAGDTTIQVDSTNRGFADAYGVLSIEDEIVIYTSRTATTFTGCIRGAFGTYATGHAVGVKVKALAVAGFITRLQEAVISTQETIGVEGAFNFASSSRVINAGTGLTGGGDLRQDLILSVVDDTTVQRIEVAKAGTLIGTRKRVNFIDGSNVSVTVEDNSANNAVNVTIAAAGGGGGGTVTSVGLSMPAQFTVTGSPVTTSGTLTASWNNQDANRVLAGPTSGSPAAPTFRSLVAADIPDLSATYSVVGHTHPGLVPTSRIIGTGTGLTGGGDLSVDRTLSVVADTTVQRVEVAKAGTLVGTRKRLNFIDGSNISVTVADDSANNRVNVTIAATGVGTVTSVGLSMPAQFSVSGSPVTTSGTLTASWVAQAANRVLAGPTSGANAAPTFRALVAADIPDLSSTYSIVGHTHANMVTLDTTQTITGEKTFSASKTVFGVNVGIGTTSPGQALDVAGKVNINTNGTAALFSTRRGADSDGLNIWIGGGGESAAGQAGNTHLGSRNVAVGINALLDNTTGHNNTAIGFDSLRLNTSGSHNVAIGRDALRANTTGGFNVAIGVHALANSVGNWNVALGVNALTSNTTGGLNVALGGNTLAANSTGSLNVAIGQGALYLNTSGSYNLAMGGMAMYSNTTGNNNVAIGHEALYSNTGGPSNVAIGFSAARANTTGWHNVGIGHEALMSGTTGKHNIGLGYRALYANVGGERNVAIGGFALYDINATSGELNNVAIGYNTGRGITTGSNNTIIGANVTGLPGGMSNNIIIADGAGNRRINVDSGGNVGIAVTSPTARLDIDGQVRIRGGSPGTNRILKSVDTSGLAEWAAPWFVTSVGLSMPTGEFTVSGSPITSSGVISVAWKDFPASRFLCTPTGTGGIPGFRSIQAADLPDLSSLYAPVGHTHAEYYTKWEVDNLLSGKANVTHSHTVTCQTAGSHNHNWEVPYDGAHEHTIYVY